MAGAIRTGVNGDFEPAYHSHFATNAALYDAATNLLSSRPEAPHPLLIAFLRAAMRFQRSGRSK